MTSNHNNLGKILKQQRVMLPLTLRDLSNMSGISPSHLGRIERGERFPSASVLRRIAQPLGFQENEIFSLAGYLSAQAADTGHGDEDNSHRRLDPYVTRLLGQEPVEVQRTVIGILSILKSITQARSSG